MPRFVQEGTAGFGEHRGQTHLLRPSYNLSKRQDPKPGKKANGKPPVMRHGTSHFNKTVSIYPEGRFPCVCRCSQPLRRTNSVCGSFSLSVDTTIEQHLPGCPATQVRSDTDRRKKTSLTYFGLQYLLNSAIQLSFMVRSGAGGWIVGSNFTY